MTSTSKSHNYIGYVPSLDGLRAIAIILVLFLHANFRLGTNGGLGVAVFFALSGFLITTLLLEEFHKTSTISFKGFYVRRTMRLFPPLYMLLAIVFIYAIFFRTGIDQHNIFKDIIASGLYFYNIARALGWCTKEILLYHTWSLSVEEQFYLIWPFILFLCIKIKALKKLHFFLTLFILLVWVLKPLGYIPFVAGSIIKESIFIGCLGALWRWNNDSPKNIPEIVILLLFALILIMGVVPFALPYYDSFFNICSIFSVIIILHLVNNTKGITSKFLSNKTMVFLGKISYSLYLWHLPVFRLFYYHSTLPPLVSFVLKFVVSFVLAILSWYTVEKATTALGRKLSNKIVAKAQHPQ